MITGVAMKSTAAALHLNPNHEDLRHRDPARNGAPRLVRSTGADASRLLLRDDGAMTSTIRLPVEHARTLISAWKQQLAELDKLQPRAAAAFALLDGCAVKTLKIDFVPT